MSRLQQRNAGSVQRTHTRVPPDSASDKSLEELSHDECLALLNRNSFGRVAVSLGDGPTVIRPVNYLFDEGSRAVVFRTAPGSKFHALIRSASAAFEIDGVDESSRTGWSVIIRGVTSEITQATELRRLDELGLEPWAPGHRPHWIQIRARTVSGRRITLADTVGHDRKAT